MGTSESDPALADLAARLADPLPASERDAARRLILARVLAPAHYESREPLDAVAHAARELERAIAEGGSQALGDAASTAELDAHQRHALALAIARHRSAPAEWRSPLVDRWLGAPNEEIAAEAERRGALLEAWRDVAMAEHPRVWSDRGTDWLRTTQWLGSARTGSFDTSSGRLFDFLHAVGVPTREFQVF